MRSPTTQALFYSMFLATGCDTRAAAPELHVERGVWTVRHCAPPAQEQLQFCHMLVCESALRNRGLIPKKAQILEVRQKYGPDGASEQIATYQDIGVQGQAKCDLKGLEVTAISALSAGDHK